MRRTVFIVSRSAHAIGELHLSRPIVGGRAGSARDASSITLLPHSRVERIWAAGRLLLASRRAEVARIRCCALAGGRQVDGTRPGATGARQRSGSTVRTVVTSPADRASRSARVALKVACLASRAIAPSTCCRYRACRTRRLLRAARHRKKSGVGWHALVCTRQVGCNRVGSLIARQRRRRAWRTVGAGVARLARRSALTALECAP